MSGPGEELGDLQVAVAGVSRQRHVWTAAADRGTQAHVERAPLVHAREDALVIGHDQSGLTGEWIDDREDLVHIGRRPIVVGEKAASVGLEQLVEWGPGCAGPA